VWPLLDVHPENVGRVGRILKAEDDGSTVGVARKAVHTFQAAQHADLP
jgi:hypothetical protein